MGPAQQFQHAERSAVAMQRTLLTKVLLKLLPETSTSTDTWSAGMTRERAQRIGESTTLMLAEAHVHVLVNTLDAQVVVFQEISSAKLEVADIGVCIVCMHVYHMCLPALLVL